MDSTRTAMWTPAVTITPRQMTSQVANAITDLHHAIEDFYGPEDEIITYRTEPTFTELLIVDFVVAAAEVLDKGMPSTDHSC